MIIAKYIKIVMKGFINSSDTQRHSISNIFVFTADQEAIFIDREHTAAVRCIFVN
jgi:hypothetical protein